MAIADVLVQPPSPSEFLLTNATYMFCRRSCRYSRMAFQSPGSRISQVSYMDGFWRIPGDPIGKPKVETLPSLGTSPPCTPPRTGMRTTESGMWLKVRRSVEQVAHANATAAAAHCRGHDSSLRYRGGPPLEKMRKNKRPASVRAFCAGLGMFRSLPMFLVALCLVFFETGETDVLSFRLFHADYIVLQHSLFAGNCP